MVIEPSEWNRTRDALRNQRHQRALNTLSRFLGNGPLDYADFLHGALVCARLCPF
jgi:hypothetical protein